jgi:hypothetical protein
MQHLHFHFTVIGWVQFLCWLGAMTACIKALIRNKALRGLPIRMRARTSRRNLPLFQYMMLAWAGSCVCDLLAPRNSFDLKLNGVFCFLFLGMAALSIYISGKVPRLPNGMPPDPDSTLHLRD